MMTVMLIRRHLRRSTTTTSTNYHSPTTTVQQQSASSFQQHQRRTQSSLAVGVSSSSTDHYHRQYPGGNPLRSAFRMTYFSPVRAMRYYRMWIYTCNAVLFICVIGFMVVALKVVVADPRRTLIPEFNLTHPSLLYAYFALIMQSGFLQLIGCVGARTLNERLLNIYWLLLFFLLIGDILLGVFWLYHFEYIVSQMKPILKNRFRIEYGTDSHFTELWDMVQREDHCCGVHNYEDYLNKSIVSWAGSSTTDHGLTLITTLPTSCCIGKEYTRPPEARRNIHFSTTSSTTTVPPLPPIFSTAEAIASTDIIIVDDIAINCSMHSAWFYTTGCEKRLLRWFRSSLDILFVLGYCVISFLKLCFLGILRYEIREMIQKIKILQTELKNALECQDTASIGVQKIQQIRHYDHNRSVIGVAQSLLDRNASTDRGSQISINNCEPNSDENEASVTSPLLFLPEKKDIPLEHKKESSQNTPMHLNLMTHQHFSTFNQDTGNDSDTNSNCALIIPEDKSSNKMWIQQQNSSTDNKNYEIHELQDLDKILIAKNRTKT